LFVVLRRFETAPADSQPERTETPTAEDDEPDTDRREYVYPLVVIYIFFITRAFGGKGIRTFIPAFIVGVYAYTFDLPGLSFTAESVANFYLSALLFIGAGTQIVLGWVVDQYDARKALVLFMFVATGGILSLAYLSLSPVLLLGVLFVIGAGIWGLNPARDMLISDITPADREGRTFGYLWTASSLTSALIPTIVGYIADAFGLRQSFGILAIGTFLAGVSILLLYSDRIYVETPADAVSQGD
jgi:MFS family permease